MRIEGIIGYSGLQLFKEEFDIEKYGFNAEDIQVECNILLSRFDVEVFNERFCWERLNAIKRLMDMGFFEEALTLSLLLPDICSQLEYPKIESGRSRYEKWYGENVDKYNIGEYGKGGRTFDCFNGYFMHNLRNRYVHGQAVGKTLEEIVNADETELRKRGYKHIYLNFSYSKNSYVLEIAETSGERFLVIYKSVPQLIMQLLSCADGAYREAEDKSKFEILLLN